MLFNNFMPFKTTAYYTLYHSKQSPRVLSLISPDSVHDKQFILPTVPERKTISEDTHTQRGRRVVSRKKSNKSAGGKRQTRRQGSKQREKTYIKPKH